MRPRLSCVIPNLHPRKVLSLLRSRVARWPVTVLTGARQTGKTTLVRDLLPSGADPPPAYISLDDPDERLRLASDPVRHLDHPGQLIILDEIQKQADLLDAVKFISDRSKERRFLLLGSSQIVLLRHVRETLAGRATLLDLWPLALVERVSGPEAPRSGLDLLWTKGIRALDRMSRQPPSAEEARRWRALADVHLKWGGYPGLEPLDEAERRVWLRDFRRTYLERDLSDLGRVADLDQFALAQNLLAARTGQILSLSEAARDLGVAVNTVKRYVRFLEISYQAHLLRPLLPTETARLVKSPKIYWTDPGLARLLSHRMEGIDGPIFETFVLDEILRWLSWQADPPQLHFHRTHAGAEVDMVIHGPRRLLAIEVKAGPKAHPTDARAIIAFLESARVPGLDMDAERIGLIVTRGREIRRLHKKVWEVPDWRLFGPA